MNHTATRIGSVVLAAALAVSLGAFAAPDTNACRYASSSYGALNTLTSVETPSAEGELETRPFCSGFSSVGTVDGTKANGIYIIVR